MIDLRLIECFVAVAEEASFSRAALRLEQPQSVMSTRLRRLEDLLRLHLLVRSSRRVALSAEGAAFLPHARALLELEATVRAAAYEIGRTTREVLAVGGYGFLADVRQKLIDAFVPRHPNITVEVHVGTRQENLARLTSGVIDLFIGLDHPGPRIVGVEMMPIGLQYGHIALPADDPLTDRPSLRLEDLRGRGVVLSPGRQDPEVIAHVRRMMADAGVHPTPAPESDRRSVENYARIVRAPHFHWLRSKRPRRSVDGYVRLPISDADFFLQRGIFWQKGNAKPALGRFLALAGAALAKRTI